MMPPPPSDLAPMPVALPDISPETRLLGTVAHYSKLRGFGFIDVTQKGLVPGDCVFVHWRAIHSTDRFPFVNKDMHVEFSVTKGRMRPGMGPTRLSAVRVSLQNGEPIALQDEVDAQTKAFIGGQFVRYTGNLKFFEPIKGFGYIVVDPGYQPVDGVEIPAEVRVDREEVNSSGENPRPMKNLAVEFGLWQDQKGFCKAYNMTLPGGVVITQAALENRQTVASDRYFGTVTVWNWQALWGFIKNDDSPPLPPHVQAKLAQQKDEAQQRAAAKGRSCSDEEVLYFRKRDMRPGTYLRKGMRVSYMLYVDDQGAGAYDIKEDVGQMG
jgi:cold shock CspA family protein